MNLPSRLRERRRGAGVGELRVVEIAEHRRVARHLHRQIVVGAVPRRVLGRVATRAHLAAGVVRCGHRERRCRCRGRCRRFVVRTVLQHPDQRRRGEQRDNPCANHPTLARPVGSADDFVDGRLRLGRRRRSAGACSCCSFCSLSRSVEGNGQCKQNGRPFGRPRAFDSPIGRLLGHGRPGRFDLRLHRFEVEARAALHRRELDGRLREFGHLLLHENKTPELELEPIEVLL